MKSSLQLKKFYNCGKVTKLNSSKLKLDAKMSTVKCDCENR